MVVGAGLTLIGCWTFYSANAAYDEAGRWMARATYVAECAPGKASAGSPGCLDLHSQQPHWPSGVEVSDLNVLLAGGTTLHATGSAVLTIGGLIFAMASIALTLGVFQLTRGSTSPSSASDQQ
jgi:hypothetical protein